MSPRNPWWYAVAIVITFGGFMAGIAVAGSSWSLLTSAPIQSAATPIDAQGSTVGVYSDVREPERDVTCRTGGQASSRRTITPAPIDSRVVQDGTTWNLIGLLREGEDGLTVVCSPKDRGSDPASYGINATADFLPRVNTGNGITWLAVSGGIGLAIWTFLTRRRYAHEENPNA